MTFTTGPISAAARDDNFKTSLWVSSALHIIALLFLYFGLPHLMPPLPTHHDLVPIDIVEISDMTNTRVKEEKSPEPPAPAPAPAPPPAPVQQQTVQPTPPPPVTKPTPPPAVPVPPTPDMAEALKPLPVQKAQPKPEPPKPKPVPQPDLMASVLKNVAKLKPAEPAQPQTEVKADAKPQAPSKPVAPSLSDRLTISDEDALRRQIEQCWNPPIGAKDAQNLVVGITMDVNPDKTVANATVDDQARYNTDTFFRAAADAAIRAVRNPNCSPLILPDGKYDQWKRITWTFDPRDM